MNNKLRNDNVNCMRCIHSQDFGTYGMYCFMHAKECIAVFSVCNKFECESTKYKSCLDCNVEGICFYFDLRRE